MREIAPYRSALVLALPVGVIVGAVVGMSLAVSAMLGGSDLGTLHLIGFGALVGLVAAAVAAGGGATAALLLRAPRFEAALRRVLVVVAAGSAVLVVTFFTGVVLLGYGGQAGGTYIWTIAAVLLAVITWACAGLLTSTWVTNRTRRDRERAL